MTAATSLVQWTISDWRFSAQVSPAWSAWSYHFPQFRTPQQGVMFSNKPDLYRTRVVTKRYKGDEEQGASYSSKWSRPFPDDAVVVDIYAADTGPGAKPAKTATKQPITLKPSTSMAGIRMLYAIVEAPGASLTGVSISYGSRAPAADLSTARAIVSSLSWRIIGSVGD